MLAPRLAVSGAKSLECPSCRTVCDVPRGKAAALPLNYDSLGA
jgi:hypothetical protein